MGEGCRRNNINVCPRLLKRKIAAEGHKPGDDTFETCDRDAGGVRGYLKRRSDAVDVQEFGTVAGCRIVESSNCFGGCDRSEIAASKMSRAGNSERNPCRGDAKRKFRAGDPGFECARTNPGKRVLSNNIDVAACSLFDSKVTAEGDKAGNIPGQAGNRHTGHTIRHIQGRRDAVNGQIH